MGIERTALVVVTAIDGTGDTGLLTRVPIVYVRLIDVARRQDLRAIGTTEDVLDIDRRLLRHIYHRTAGDTLLITATIGGTYRTTHQVDNARDLIEVEAIREGFCCRLGHAQAVEGTCTEELRIGEIHDAVRNVDEHIAVILQLITFTVARIALTGTEDFRYLIISVRIRLEIDERIMLNGLAGDTLTCSYRIVVILIVIVAGAAAQEILHPTLRVLRIGSRMLDVLQAGFIHHILDSLNLTGEVTLSSDDTAQVVTAIDIVTDIGEAVRTYIGLRMSMDVGITAAAEGVEDTTVVQIDVGVARNRTLISTTVDILTVSHIRGVARNPSCHAGITTVAIEVDIGAVLRVIIIFQNLSIRVVRILFVTVSLADGTLLATAEDLEGITLVQVDGGATPDLGVATIAAAEDAQGRGEHVRTLL